MADSFISVIPEPPRETSLADLTEQEVIDTVKCKHRTKCAQTNAMYKYICEETGKPNNSLNPHYKQAADKITEKKVACGIISHRLQVKEWENQLLEGKNTSAEIRLKALQVLETSHRTVLRTARNVHNLCLTKPQSTIHIIDSARSQIQGLDDTKAREKFDGCMRMLRFVHDFEANIAAIKEKVDKKLDELEVKLGSVEDRMIDFNAKLAKVAKKLAIKEKEKSQLLEEIEKSKCFVYGKSICDEHISKFDLATITQLILRTRLIKVFKNIQPFEGTYAECGLLKEEIWEMVSTKIDFEFQEGRNKPIVDLAPFIAPIDDRINQRVAQLLDYKSSISAGTSKSHHIASPPLIDISTEDIADVTYIESTSSESDFENDIEFIDDKRSSRTSNKSTARTRSRRRRSKKSRSRSSFD